MNKNSIRLTVAYTPFTKKRISNCEKILTKKACTTSQSISHRLCVYVKLCKKIYDIFYVLCNKDKKYLMKALF
jgi:hypothetical protein